MSLHHVKIAHNSEPNRADHRRIGFAIRYVAAHVKQSGGARDMAMLVRGSDSWNFFDREDGAVRRIPARGSRTARAILGGDTARPGRLPPRPCDNAQGRTMRITDIRCFIVEASALAASLPLAQRADGLP